MIIRVGGGWLIARRAEMYGFSVNTLKQAILVWLLIEDDSI